MLRQHEAGGIWPSPPVASSAEMRMVYRLVHDCDAEKGYISLQPNGLFISSPHFDAASQTMVLLIALLRGEIVGTFSMTLDGPLGFPFDKDFAEECEVIRRQGRILAAGWRLAIKKACRSQRTSQEDNFWKMMPAPKTCLSWSEMRMVV